MAMRHRLPGVTASVRTGPIWQCLARWLLVVCAVVAPGGWPSAARASAPVLILAPDRGHYQGDCTQATDGVVMALGRDFPEGAGVALYAMRSEGAPLRRENIETLLATVVVTEGRFVAGNVGLRTLLCWARERYPHGARIEVVAATTVNFDPANPSNGTALARTVFTVDSTTPLPATERCFGETFLCVQNRFHDYWTATGGLARHGYPLSGEMAEQLEDGQTYTVQYFERSRLEYHPENRAPDEVLLGQFGRRTLATVPDAPIGRATPLPGQAYFDVTGHNVAPDFATYRAAHGGLAGFGLPLSEEFNEFLQTGAPGEGRVYRVQYFERARFERHPENQAPYDILLGQFGRQVLGEAVKPPDSQYPAAGICPAAQGAVATVRVNTATPAPRCQVVRPEQRLQVVNSTSQLVRVRLAQIDVTVPPQGAWTSNQPFGTYLAPGVHLLAISAYAGGGAALWLQR